MKKREGMTGLPRIFFLFIVFPRVFLPPSVSAHSPHERQDVFSSMHVDEKEKEELAHMWGHDMGFSGISTFAHHRHVKCLTHPEERFDIGIIGAPFDTAVTYRPGARFGPRAIRAASSRQSPSRGFNTRASINPYTSWATIIDCGDIPITPFDNAVALTQMSEAFLQLGSYLPAYTGGPHTLREAEKDRKPKLITLGGDHSVALPALRALNKIYGHPIAVLHFDAHLDTWNPASYSKSWRSETSDFTHGSMFWMASNEGLILNGSSVHAGLRNRLVGDGWDDYDDDDRQGFLRLPCDDIDEIGPKGIIEAILERIGTETPTYLSIDIDVIDPGLAPGTGTPEPGGWTTREMIKILRGVEGLNVVGADIVEVAPAYDNQGESTAQAASQLVYEVITSMVKRELKPRAKKSHGKDEL